MVSGFGRRREKNLSARVRVAQNDKPAHIDQERAFAKADEERRRAEALGVEMVVRPADRAECGVSLAIWMARSQTVMATVALGLIIGGAVGNAIDRLAYGAVVDFALFHVQIGANTYNG